MKYLSLYGDAEGPLGIPMKDVQAKQLDTLLRALPAEQREPRRVTTAKATTEVMEGERSDVSWISTEALDHTKEIVLASGLDDSVFSLNPIVTLGHSYYQPPIGRSLWRKKTRSGDMKGVKAKTVYPQRPEEHPPQQPWRPDEAYGLVKAGLMLGKSIGFISLDASAPTPEEVKAHPDWAEAYRIIRKWLLLEYACTWMPCNPECITQEVSKSLTGLGIDHEPPPPETGLPGGGEHLAGFMTLADAEKAIITRISGIDVAALAQQAVQDALARRRGRV